MLALIKHTEDSKDVIMLDKDFNKNQADTVWQIRESLKYEYYVHYLEFEDGRFDRWVTEHRIEVSKTEQDK